MENTEDEPIRREAPGPYSSSQLPSLRDVLLPPPSQIRGSFLAALAERRSAEIFTPIAVHELSTWLHFTASIQAVNAQDPNRQLRFVGSMGALHPTHIVLGHPDDTWTAYVPTKHVLGELLVDPVIAAMLRTKARQYFPAENATLIALVGDVDLASHYYLNPRSMMLREAGVLLGHGALVAAALGLGFRILGGTGTPFVEELMSNLPFTCAATGLAWIGGGRAV